MPGYCFTLLYRGFRLDNLTAEPLHLLAIASRELNLKPPMTSIKRTLLTGFGSFGPVVNNPAQRIVEHFALCGVPGHQLTTHVFPVTFEGVAASMQSLLQNSGPFDNVVMLGVSADSNDWRIERLGKNWDDAGRVDSTGVTSPGGPISSGKEVTLACTLPVDRIVTALVNAGIPAVGSDSAGGYLCNHLLYITLDLLRDAETTRAGFIHIPADPLTFSNTHDGRWHSFDKHIRAVQTSLDVL